jgi:hypothetical protein
MAKIVTGSIIIWAPPFFAALISLAPRSELVPAAFKIVAAVPVLYSNRDKVELDAISMTVAEKCGF